MNTTQATQQEPITTNLAAILKAVEDELHKEEKALASLIVSHMLDTGKIKLRCKTESCRMLLN